MKKTKKQIKKEFILLISCFLFSFILFCCIFPYNWILQSKYRNINKIIEKKNTDKKSLVDAISYMEFLRSDHEPNDLVDSIRLKIDCNSLASIKQAVLKPSESNLVDSDFITTLLAKDDDYYYSKIASLKNINTELEHLKNEKAKYNKSIFSLEKQLSFAFSALLIILIIMFPIRFLYLGIKWALKTGRHGAILEVKHITNKWLRKTKKQIANLSKQQKVIIAIIFPLFLVVITFAISEANYYNAENRHGQYFGFSVNWWLWLIYIALVGIFEFKLFEQKKDE